jgi:hypothetical protein
MGIFQHVSGVFRVDFAMLAHFFITAGSLTVGTKAASDHAEERTVHRLTHNVRFGSLYEYVASFGIFNGADVGKTIDNGLYLLIIYFSWFAVLLTLWYLFKVFKMTINAFGDNQNFRVQLYLFTPVSLFFTGSIFSPEYAFLIVCPFILRKALNITNS